MRTNAKGEITLLLLVSLAVLTAGSPLMSVPLQSGIECHDSFTPAYTPHDAILLDGNAEMIAQATAETWPGNGTAAAPYEITGYYFYDVTHSVEIRNIDLHWTFTDNEVDGPGDSNVWCGIEISNSSNGYVANNLFHNRYRGVWLIDIFEVTIVDNIVEDNLFNGIECEGFINACLIADNTIRRNDGSGIRTLTAVDSEISGNDISDCSGLGIQVMSYTTGCQIINNRIDNVAASGINLGFSTSVSIMHNQIINASGEGIYVRGSQNLEVFNNSLYDGEDDAIAVRDCAFGTIHNNTIEGTDGIGIYVDSGGNSTFRFNRIEDSTEYGLETAIETGDMTITRNVFINNGAASQVCDEGEDNTFIYNYFDDWTSPDADADLIVDVAYVLDGETGNEDPYPLAEPDAVPPSTEEPTTTPGGFDGQIPLELVAIAGGAVVVVLVGVFFMKKRT
jgi:parallel beta-helix repeat protein